MIPMNATPTTATITVQEYHQHQQLRPLWREKDGFNDPQAPFLRSYQIGSLRQTFVTRSISSIGLRHVGDIPQSASNNSVLWDLSESICEVLGSCRLCRHQKATKGIHRHAAAYSCRKPILINGMTGSCWSSCSLQKAPWRHKAPAKVLNIWRNCLEHQTFLKIWQHFWVLQPQRIDKVSMATCQAKCLWPMQIEHFTKWRRNK